MLSADGPDGTVYSFTPGSPEDQLTRIAPTPVDGRAGVETAIPANYWNNGEFTDQYDAKADHFTTLAEMFARDIARPAARHYLSPDGSSCLTRVPHVSAGTGLALVARDADLRVHHGQARCARVRKQ